MVKNILVLGDYSIRYHHNNQILNQIDLNKMIEIAKKYMENLSEKFVRNYKHLEK